VLDKSQVKPEESLQISLRIQNIGERAGEEVLQLYIRDDYASSPRPLKQLRGFVRVALDPGETKQVHFDLPIEQLAYYGPGLQLKVEAGNFKVMVAAAADDVRLEGSFEVTATKTLDSRKRVINCPVRVETLALA
jgi:beta-glucosidase